VASLLPGTRGAQTHSALGRQTGDVLLSSPARRSNAKRVGGEASQLAAPLAAARSQGRPFLPLAAGDRKFACQPKSGGSGARAERIQSD